MQDRRVTRLYHLLLLCALLYSALLPRCTVHLKEQAVCRQAGRMTWECIEVVADQPEHNLTT